MSQNGFFQEGKKGNCSRLLPPEVSRGPRTHSKVCCLPGAQGRGITKKLHGPVQPSDYKPLVIVQAGSYEVAERSLKAIKRDFRALGQLVDATGVQVVFSTSPSMASKGY